MEELDRGLFRERGRAESFGSRAAVYDATRPAYPVELIDRLGPPGVAADVGCGTGQVARLLTAGGWRVIGVEVDARMADVARSHGLEVHVGRFEDWQPDGRFHLIASGQAWHWVDPDIGHRRAGELLQSGGLLALFWNSYRYDEATQDVVLSVVGRHAPHLLEDSLPFGTASPHHAELDAELIRQSAEWFEEPDFTVFPHARTQHVNEWLAEMTTHSPVATLPVPVREAMLGDLGAALREHGDGRVEVAYETRLTTARRR